MPNGLEKYACLNKTDVDPELKINFISNNDKCVISEV